MSPIILQMMLVIIAMVTAKKDFHIIFPYQYVLNKSLEFNITNIGFVPYGQQLSGQLYKAKPFEQCQHTQINTKNEGYNPTQNNNLKILLALRGNCEYSTKAFNAQVQGYQMLIIINKNKNQTVDKYNMSQVDKGQINIPVIIISNNDGKCLLQLLNEPNIQVLIEFPSIPQSPTVQYEYWFNVGDPSHYLFLEQFYQFHMLMQNNLIFIPHYVIYAKNEYRYQDSWVDTTKEIYQLQILRQICIYQDSPLKWWSYAIIFNRKCLQNIAVDICYNEILDNLKINKSKIELCIQSSFAQNHSTTYNKLILNEQELLDQKFGLFDFGFQDMLPALFINGIQLNGSLTGRINDSQYLNEVRHFHPLQTICRTLQSDSVPRICSEIISGYNYHENKITENLSPFEDWMFGGIVGGVCILWIIFIICCGCYKIKNKSF